MKRQRAEEPALAPCCSSVRTARGFPSPAAGAYKRAGDDGPERQQWSGGSDRSTGSTSLPALPPTVSRLYKYQRPLASFEATRDFYVALNPNVKERFVNSRLPRPIHKEFYKCDVSNKCYHGWTGSMDKSDRQLGLLWTNGRRDEVRSMIRPLPEHIQGLKGFGPEGALDLRAYLVSKRVPNKELKAVHPPAPHTRKTHVERSAALKALMDARLTAEEQDVIYEWYVESWCWKAQFGDDAGTPDRTWTVPPGAYETVVRAMTLTMDGFAATHPRPDPAYVVPGALLGKRLRRRGACDMELDLVSSADDVHFALSVKEERKRRTVDLYAVDESSARSWGYFSPEHLVARLDESGTSEVHERAPERSELVGRQRLDLARLEVLDALEDDFLGTVEALDAKNEHRCLFCQRPRDGCDGCMQAFRRFMTEDGWTRPESNDLAASLEEKKRKRRCTEEEPMEDIMRRESGVFRSFRTEFPEGELEVFLQCLGIEPEVMEIFEYWLRAEKAFTPERAADIVNLCDQLEVDWTPLFDRVLPSISHFSRSFLVHSL